MLKIIEDEGVTPYPGSVRYLEAAKAAGLRIGVVTSSANGAKVLDAADLTKFVEARIDGIVIAEKNLRGKPAPIPSSSAPRRSVSPRRARPSSRTRSRVCRRARTAVSVTWSG